MDPNLHSLQRTHLRPEAVDLFQLFDRRFAHPQPRPSLRSQVPSGAIWELNLQCCTINVALMGSGKGIQLFAFIVLFATGLAGCASSNKPGEPRSEERRVGKEYRSRVARDHQLRDNEELRMA